MRLDARYVTDAVRLGYVSTDYGNQGATSESSITLVSEATSAGGLYVGTTRGRFENQLHIVAEDDDDARAKLVAALERDRADRGLDVAQARAETDSVPVSDVPVRRSPEHRRISTDPTTWRSAAELDRAERAIDAKLAHDLRLHRVPPLLSDEQRAQRTGSTARQQQRPGRRPTGIAARPRASRAAATSSSAKQAPSTSRRETTLG
ncbi:MAG TPA: hypothetical protein VMD59_02445 [Acidimicrobiales bacterium]|nr:hypothetical protein [Acidimicrobiales bacterium]